MRAAVLPLIALMAAAPGAPAARPAAPPAPDGYDARVRAAFRAAEAFQGPLDGGWTLSTRDGLAFGLQLVDHDGKLEGTWRDLRRPGALGAGGFVEVLERSASKVRLRFQPSGDLPISLLLHPSADHGWSGELRRGDQEFTFVLKRASP